MFSRSGPTEMRFDAINFSGRGQSLKQLPWNRNNEVDPFK